MWKLARLAVLLVLCASPADAATRKQCKPRACRGEIELCKGRSEGTFRRLDGSECSVTIHAQAKIGCDTSADCTAGEVCTTTDPSSPTDFGNAFPGWSGQSCVLQP